MLTRPLARLLVAHVRVTGLFAPIDNILAQLAPAAEHVGTMESPSAHRARLKGNTDIQNDFDTLAF